MRTLGGERYELAGKLTINDRGQNLAASVNFRPEGSVGDGVQIRLHIVAAPATTFRMQRKPHARTE
jgi:hypothetical protein